MTTVHDPQASADVAAGWLDPNDPDRGIRYSNYPPGYVDHPTRGHRVADPHEVDIWARDGGPQVIQRCQSPACDTVCRPRGACTQGAYLTRWMRRHR